MVDYTKATNTPPPKKWHMLTLKLQAKDFELTFQSQVKTKVFSRLNILDLSLVITSMDKDGKSLQKNIQRRLDNLHDSDVGNFNPKIQAKRIAKKMF